MSNEQGYNGWTNYETWQAALWLGEADYQGMIEEQDFDDARELAQHCRDFVESLMLVDSDGNSLLKGSLLVTDILSSWANTVDWQELGEHYYTDWKASHPDEEDED